MEERGYLFLLIGVGMLAAPTLLGAPNDVAGFGWIPLFMGIRSMRTSGRELQNALYFAIFGLVISWSLWFGIEFVPELFFQFQLVSLFIVLRVFFDAGTFFWLLKAEYMWAPNQQKRLEWLGFSAVGATYFLVSAIITFSTTSMFDLPINILFSLFRISRPIAIVYHGVLVFIFVKLYLEAKGNSGGLRRWN